VPVSGNEVREPPVGNSLSRGPGNLEAQPIPARYLNKFEYDRHTLLRPCKAARCRYTVHRLTAVVARSQVMYRTVLPPSALALYRPLSARESSSRTSSPGFHRHIPPLKVGRTLSPPGGITGSWRRSSAMRSGVSPAVGPSCELHITTTNSSPPHLEIQSPAVGCVPTPRRSGRDSHHRRDGHARRLWT
jgi:hypothetical protein